MTHHTDAERAEFEAAYVSEKLRIIGSEGSSDGEKAIRTIHLRRNANGDYDNSLEAHFAWWAWQAARRAPAAPVPQGWKLVPVESTEAMARAFRADDAPGYFCMTTLRCADFSERYAAMLAAAPQPPEAAPVVLPEPDAWRYTDARGHYRYRGRRHGFAAEYPLLKPVALYTGQQVRELLAAHGIGKDKA